MFNLANKMNLKRNNKYVSLFQNHAKTINLSCQEQHGSYIIDLILLLIFKIIFNISPKNMKNVLIIHQSKSMPPKLKTELYSKLNQNITWTFITGNYKLTWEHSPQKRWKIIKMVKTDLEIAEVVSFHSNLRNNSRMTLSTYMDIPFFICFFQTPRYDHFPLFGHPALYLFFPNSPPLTTFFG